ncbi:helix-turn-helix transcriptional regulator [Flavonifractor sp. An306]|uniref:helix-turn-helix transcriptional regulator n=1 Tax=Flavonifractor sp. An306 TaxID=1965629 RepID=UPI0034518177
MSQELGVTYKTYNSYITGKTPIPSDILEKLRDITGRSIDYLLGLQTDNAS